MTLNLIPCGLDFGNGWIKIVINGKASKIPNWAILSEPLGQLNAKSQLLSIPMAFCLEIGENLKWFGQDTLGKQGYQEIDSDKYKPDYIKPLFKAALYRWLIQHRVDPEWLMDKRLNVVCGMPPEQYQNRQARNKAEKVFRYVFNVNKTDYIKMPDKPAIPFFTAFESVKPETLAWRESHGLKPGFTLLVDLGYGTSDLCLLHSTKETPISTKSLTNGLFHSHNETDPIRPWLVELDTLRGTTPEFYANVTKAKIRSIARQIKLTQLVVFGGGARLLDAETLKDMKGYADTVTIGKGYDEFTNARMFERLGAKNG